MAGKKQNRVWMRDRLVLTCVLLLCLFVVAFVGCKSGYHPVDDLRKELQQKLTTTEKASDATQTSAPKETEKEAAKESPTTEATTVVEKDAKAAPETSKKVSETPTTTVPEPQGPKVSDIRKALEDEGFSFWVNTLLKDPEPQEVIYADKTVGKAELTVLYGVFESTEEADRAIQTLLESDMIGKAMSFGAELEKLKDGVDSKQYTVSLNSLFATARAELRQDNERIGVVILYKKNKDVVFDPYFELMELPIP